MLTRYPVTCLTWFDETLVVHGEPLRDWKFDSTQSSPQAMRQALAWTTPPPKAPS